jgi:hypothetical protein
MSASESARSKIARNFYRLFNESGYTYLTEGVAEMEMEFRPTRIVEVPSTALRRLKVHRAEHYLRGPIRLADIKVAAKLGGSCLAVLLAIHFRCAVTKRNEVTLPSGFLSDFGIDKNAKARVAELRIGKAHRRQAHPRQDSSG